MFEVFFLPFILYFVFFFSNQSSLQSVLYAVFVWECISSHTCISWFCVWSEFYWTAVNDAIQVILGQTFEIAFLELSDWLTQSQLSAKIENYPTRYCITKLFFFFADVKCLIREAEEISNKCMYLSIPHLKILVNKECKIYWRLFAEVFSVSELTAICQLPPFMNVKEIWGIISFPIGHPLTSCSLPMSKFALSNMMSEWERS